ncbi:MAG: hypothetical protein NZ893_02380, partial [Candidatus Aenigmarchaeota archaeon]|nr:hypothetical protein [Candidatus Aenigmarchaeota archaeon]
ISLFQDFVISSGVIRRPKAQKIVGACLGLIAYRGFAVTNLLEILSLGTLGIALLALNLVFLGGLLAYLHRVFERWRPLEAAMNIVRSSAAFRRSLRDYIRAAERAAREGDQHALLEILDNMEHITTRTDWLGMIRQLRQSVLQNNYQNFYSTLEALRNSVEHPS